MKHNYPAISRSTLAEVCDLLGVDPNEVASIRIDPLAVTVYGRPEQVPLVLPVVVDA